MNVHELDQLERIIVGFAECRVLCVGDLILDTFNHGTVSRISAESPIPVFNAGANKTVPGGAANVARNLVALGGHCVLVGAIGVDVAGGVLRAALDGDPSIVSDLVPDPNRKTSHKIRYVAQGQHMLRVDDETSCPVTGSVEVDLIARATARMAECQALVLSDYAKGVVTDSVARNLIREARARGLPVIVDPKTLDFTRYSGATLLTPNLKEAEAAVAMPMGDDEAIAAGGSALLERTAIDALLITRSENGMTLISRDAPAQHIRSQVEEVFDVVGAGDTVIATLALALASDVEHLTAARLANIAAEIVVGKRGTATVAPDELLERLTSTRAGSGRLGAPVLLSAEDAGRYAQARRGEGKRIGFTNGVFDIVHPGHVSLLEFARMTCDCLIVALNSDASVRRLGKGPERPINTELDRAAVLGAFGTVNAVVIFDEDTPIELIRAIRPDVLIKGADYTIDTVVGSDIVLGYGGEVKLAGLVSGKSSTNIIIRAQVNGEVP